MRNVRRFFVVALMAGLLHVSAIRAAAAEFDFKDPKGVNAMSFVLDSLLEPIMGVASGVSGRVNFDPADVTKTTGKIVVDAKTLYTPNTGMTETLHGGDWLNVGKNPTVEFTVKSIKDVKKVDGNVSEAAVTGDFLCNGVTKELTVPVKFAHLPGRAGDRMRGAQGDLLILRSTFTISRADFKIKPGGNDVVADNVEVRVSIVGMAAKK